jgi:hypothetical protein
MKMKSKESRLNANSLLLKVEPDSLIRASANFIQLKTLLANSNSYLVSRFNPSRSKTISQAHLLVIIYHLPELQRGIIGETTVR